MRNVYLKFLVAEILTIAAVVMTFKTISERLIAGAVAGSIFTALGIAIVWYGIANKRFKSFSFYAGLAHLFLSSLPLMITRLLNYSAGFDEVHVLGLPGPMFHQVSTSIFMLLIVATLVDAYRLRKSAVV